jgi:Flp pilus assembly protein TadG
MRVRQDNRKRKATTLIEWALTTAIFLMLCLGIIDLGTGVLRQHILTQAARQAARQAIVHGTYDGDNTDGNGYTNQLTPWGPTTYNSAANASDPKAQAVAAYLPGLDPANVTVKMEWPDNSNAVEKRVKVTLTTSWTPIVTGFFGGQTITLTASSQMLIAH